MDIITYAPWKGGQNRQNRYEHDQNDFACEFRFNTKVDNKKKDNKNGKVNNCRTNQYCDSDARA